MQINIYWNINLKLLKLIFLRFWFYKSNLEKKNFFEVLLLIINFLIKLILDFLYFFY